MALNANALTTVADLMSYMGESIPVSEQISIYHDESDSATAAKVAVSQTVGTMTLTVTGGDNAGTTVLTLSTYSTLTALVAAINALDKGYVATVLLSGSGDPTLLDTLGTSDCFGAAAVKYLTAQDTYAYEQAINTASDHIELLCGRTFAAAEYTHMYCGKGVKEITVAQAPIIRVHRIAIGRREAFRVKNTSTDCMQANFGLESASARLDVVGGANANSSTVAYDSTTTLTTFVAAIIAVGYGWTAEILGTGEGSWLVADCLDFNSRDAKDSWMTVWAPYENQDRYDVDNGAGIIHRTGWGVASIHSLWLGSSFWGGHIYPFELRPLTGESAGSRWPDGVFNVYIKYRAGYETIPADIKWVCEEFAKNHLRNARRNTALSSEAVEGYTWSSGFAGPTGRSGAEGALTQHIKQALAPHRRYLSPDFVEV